MHNLIFLAQVPEGRVFGLDSQTLIGIGIQLFNAIVLSVVLGYLLYDPVKEFMQNRKNRIQGRIDKADATQAKAEELIAEYDLKIKEINKERIEMLEVAREKANEEGEAIIEEAKKEARLIKERSLESVKADKKRLQEETRLYIIELASLMAEKYITKSIDDEAQEQLFEETLAQMGESQWQS